MWKIHENYPRSLKKNKRNMWINVKPMSIQALYALWCPCHIRDMCKWKCNISKTTLNKNTKPQVINVNNIVPPLYSVHVIFEICLTSDWMQVKVHFVLTPTDLLPTCDTILCVERFSIKPIYIKYYKQNGKLIWILVAYYVLDSVINN